MEEEEYGGVNERRRHFMKSAPQQPSKYSSDTCVPFQTLSDSLFLRKEYVFFLNSVYALVF